MIENEINLERASGLRILDACKAERFGDLDFWKSFSSGLLRIEEQPDWCLSRENSRRSSSWT